MSRHYKLATTLWHPPLLIFFVVVILATGIIPSLSLTARPALADENIVPETIRFSQDSVVTRQPVLLAMENLVEGGIRYTTNGALPDAASTPYSGPIPINEPTVIRAQMFDGAGNPLGNVYTKSYLIVTYDQTIPVMSLTTAWADFDMLHTFPRERGQEWERPLNIEYFTPGGQLGFNVKAGYRIHGGFSRFFSAKKSYRLYFRKDYGGPGKLEYPLFADTPVTQFDKLVLRAGFQDSFLHRGIPERSDTHLTAKYIGDQVVRNLHRDMGQPVAHGNWVLVYWNGKFWGLYNLTERVDLDFLRSYSAEDADWDIIAKESGWENEIVWFNREEAKEGDYGAWLENQDWVANADFSKPENIGVLEWRVDMENVFSYMFLQAYVQNYDWPGTNWIVYRRKDAGAMGNEGKWRMLVWDAEYSFGGGSEGFKTDMNTIVRVYSPHDSITRILEKPFIHHCALKHRFAQRAREYLGVENPYNKPPTEVGQLSKERVKAEITKQADIVRPFIPMEAERWAPDLNVQLFEQNIQNSLKFVDERQEVILHHLDVLLYQTFTTCQ